MRDITFAFLGFALAYVKATPQYGSHSGRKCPPKWCASSNPPACCNVGGNPPITTSVFVPPANTYVPPVATYIPPVVDSPGGSIPQSQQCSGSSRFQVSWSGMSVPLDNGASTEGCTDLSAISSGRLTIAPSRAPDGSMHGTLLEWSPDSVPHVDVSFNEAFTVPVTCTHTTGSTGCPYNLLSPDSKDSSSGLPGFLLNPTYLGGEHDPGPYTSPAGVPWCWTCNAPTQPWALCSGSAYVYPYDDLSMGGQTNLLSCCVGTAADGCTPTGREGTGAGGFPRPDQPDKPCALCPAGTSKRGLEQGLLGDEMDANGTSVAEDLRRHLGHNGHRRRHHPAGLIDDVLSRR